MTQLDMPSAGCCLVISRVKDPLLGEGWGLGGRHGCIITALLASVSCEDAEDDFHLHLFGISRGQSGGD